MTLYIISKFHFGDAKCSLQFPQYGCSAVASYNTNIFPYRTIQLLHCVPLCNRPRNIYHVVTSQTVAQMYTDMLLFV